MSTRPPWNIWNHATDNPDIKEDEYEEMIMNRRLNEYIAFNSARLKRLEREFYQKYDENQVIVGETVLDDLPLCDQLEALIFDRVATLQAQGYDMDRQGIIGKLKPAFSFKDEKIQREAIKRRQWDKVFLKEIQILEADKKLFWAETTAPIIGSWMHLVHPERVHTMALRQEKTYEITIELLAHKASKLDKIPQVFDLTHQINIKETPTTIHNALDSPNNFRFILRPKKEQEIEQFQTIMYYHLVKNEISVLKLGDTDQLMFIIPLAFLKARKIIVSKTLKRFFEEPEITFVAVLTSNEKSVNYHNEDQDGFKLWAISENERERTMALDRIQKVKAKIAERLPQEVISEFNQLETIQQPESTEEKRPPSPELPSSILLNLLPQGPKTR